MRPRWDGSRDRGEPEGGREGGEGGGRKVAAVCGRVAGGSDMTIEEEEEEGGWGGRRERGNEPSSVVINGLNWISVERLIGDCRPPEDGVEQNCEQNCLGLERVVCSPHGGCARYVAAEEEQAVGTGRDCPEG